MVPYVVERIVAQGAALTKGRVSSPTGAPRPPTCSATERR
jgi:hypothetical protein